MFRAFLLATAASAVLAPAALAQAPQRPAPPATPPAQTPSAQTQTPAAPQDPATEVQAVTVTADRNAVRTSIDRRSYSLANDLQATTGSLADALRNVPQVEVDVQGNVSLRGDSSVRILIDGRPSTLLNGANRADVLQQMSAADIERVEVITNPSAAFSPEGSGGAINLITRRNRRSAQYATVRGNLDPSGRVNGGISAAYNSERFTLSGDAGFRFDRRPGSSEGERVRTVTGGENRARRSSETNNRSRMFNWRAAAEWNPDPRNRFSASVNAFDGRFQFDALSRYDEQGPTGLTTQANTRRSNGEFTFRTVSGQTGWRRTFSGEQHELAADLSWDRTTFGNHSRTLVIDTAPVAGVSTEANQGDTTQDLGRIKIDYNRPLGGPGERLQVGYELEYSASDIDTVGQRGPGQGAIPNDPNVTNTFQFDQTVNAIYGTYQRQFGDLAAQFGLRVEQVDRGLNQRTLGLAIDRSDIAIYPTLHLSYDLNDRQQLTASYSLRVQRPQAEELNPFIVYVDPFNRSSGNPNLRDQRTHSFELGWQYRQGSSLFLATAFYRVSNNVSTQVVQDLGDGVFLSTRANVAERQSGGVELVTNGRLTSQLTYNASGSVFYEEFGPTFGAPRQEGVSWTLRGSLNWQPTDRDFLQVNAFGNGRRLLPQGYVEPFGVLSLGYRRKIDDRLSLVATIRDVLNTSQSTRVIETATFRDRSENRFGGRALFLGFTLNLGQPSAQQQRRDQGFDFGGGGAPGGGPGG